MSRSAMQNQVNQYNKMLKAGGPRPLVQPLAARGAAAVVPVRVVGAERPFRVEIDVPARAFLG